MLCGKNQAQRLFGQRLKPKSGNIVLLSPQEPSSVARMHSRHLPPKGEERKLIGQHQGLYNFTIGQRQGIDVGGTGPYYVTKKDLKSNTLYVTNNPNDESLMTKEVQLHSVNWISQGYNLTPKTYNLLGRFRHQGELMPLTIEKNGSGGYKSHFFQPQKAVASGQSLVLYKGKECLGGGIIG